MNFVPAAKIKKAEAEFERFMNNSKKSSVSSVSVADPMDIDSLNGEMNFMAIMEEQPIKKAASGSNRNPKASKKSWNTVGLSPRKCLPSNDWEISLTKLIADTTPKRHRVRQSRLSQPPHLLHAMEQDRRVNQQPHHHQTTSSKPYYPKLMTALALFHQATCGT